MTATSRASSRTRDRVDADFARDVLPEDCGRAAQRRGPRHRHHGAGSMSAPPIATFERPGARSWHLVVVVVILMTTGDAWRQEPRLDVSVERRRWDGYEPGQHRSVDHRSAGADRIAGHCCFEQRRRAAAGAAAPKCASAGGCGDGVYAEATGGLGVNTIEAHVSDDIERAPAITVSSTLTQITVEGGALVELPARSGCRRERSLPSSTAAAATCARSTRSDC